MMRDGAEAKATTENCGQGGGMSRSEAITVFLLVAVALGVRIYLLRFYDLISSDGTGYVHAARALARGDLSQLSAYGFYPVLLWLVSLLGPDMESAGRYVSVFLGSLLIVPLYLLGKDLFSPRCALAACMVTTVWPPLLHWSCEVMTQATYMLLAVTGIYLVRRTVIVPSLSCGAAAGLCLGFAYLTRTEAFLLFFVLPCVPLLYHRREAVRFLKPLAAYGAAFAAILAVNLLLIRLVTGEWQLAAKTSAALNDALSAYLKVNDLGYLPEFSSTGYLDILRSYPDFVRVNTIQNLKQIWTGLLPLPLWILCLGGFLAGGFGADRNRDRLFLLATFCPLFVIIVFYYVGPEYTQPYLPVLFLWGGEGAWKAERFLVEKIPVHLTRQLLAGKARFSLTLIIALVFSCTVFVRQIPSATPPDTYRPEQDDGRRDQKNIGLLLKRHLPPGKIMTRWGRIAYYAEREWTTIPQVTVEEIIASARRQEVRFLVVDGNLFANRPQLAELLEPLTIETERLFFVRAENTSAGKRNLKMRLIYLDPTSKGVVVYEIVG
jgi:4-amino-4-deoxy-L-arabinose transferase-like glycosyltransferase